VANTRRYAEFRSGWPVVLAAMLGIGLGLSPVPFYTMGMFAPVLAREFGWSYGAILAGFPILTFTVLFMSPVVGQLSDRFGVRRVALISVVLFGLTFMAFSVCNGELWPFYATWTLLAVVGSGTLPITWTRAVNNRFEASKGLALGLSLVGTGLFGFFIKPLTAWLIAQYGWRAAFVCIGALPLLIALPVALWAFHDVAPTDALADPHARAAREKGVAGLSFAQTLRQWRFWILGCAFVPISFAVGGPIPNMENILRLRGFGPSAVVSLAQLIGLSVIAGRVGGGYLIDRVWAPGAAFILLFAPAAACWFMARGHLSYSEAAACICALGITAGVEYDLMAFLVARYFGMKSYGAIYGTLYGFFALGAGIGPVIFGRAFDRTHSYDGVLTASCGLFVLGGVLLLLLGRYRNFDEPSTAVNDLD
jgi:MFS family permease